MTHRQYTDTGGVQGLDPRPGDRNVVPPRMPGFHCEQEEINPEPSPGNRILGPISGLHSNGAKTSSDKDEAYSSRSSQVSKKDINISPCSGAATGEDERNKLCSSPSPLILPPPANGSSQHIGEEFPMLQGSGLTDTRLPGRVGMVEHQHEQVEWQNSLEARYRLSDRLRCIPGGMGCLLLRPENRGPVVMPGVHDAYKLSQATCSNLGIQNVCQIQNSNIHPAENQQHHDNSLHKQPWRYSLQGASATHTRSVDVVPGKEHPHHSSTSTRGDEYNS